MLNLSFAILDAYTNIPSPEGRTCWQKLIWYAFSSSIIQLIYFSVSPPSKPNPNKARLELSWIMNFLTYQIGGDYYEGILSKLNRKRFNHSLYIKLLLKKVLFFFVCACVKGHGCRDSLLYVSSLFMFLAHSFSGNGASATG
ncbi:hypothetical protein ACJX0J_035396 [Zea mays]